MRNPRANDPVTITVTQEQLYVLTSGLEHMADLEDEEFSYIREVAENLSLPETVLRYQDMKAQ